MTIFDQCHPMTNCSRIKPQDKLSSVTKCAKYQAPFVTNTEPGFKLQTNTILLEISFRLILPVELLLIVLDMRYRHSIGIKCCIISGACYLCLTSRNQERRNSTISSFNQTICSFGASMKKFKVESKAVLGKVVLSE